MSYIARRIEPLEILPSNLDYSELPRFRPTMEWVDPTDLYVDPRYQRDITRKSLNVIKKIIREWDWNSFKPPIVTKYEDEDRLFIIDGQHTSIAAASHPEIKEIPVFVVDSKFVKSSAKAFIRHNNDRTNVDPIQLFKAEVESGDEVATGVNMAIQRSGVKLSTLSNINNDQIGYCSSVVTLKKVYDAYGLMPLRTVLEICVQAKMNTIQSFVVYGLADLLYKDPIETRFHYDKDGLVELLIPEKLPDILVKVNKQFYESKVPKKKSFISILDDRYKDAYCG